MKGNKDNKENRGNIYGYWSSTEESSSREFDTAMKKLYDSLTAAGFSEAQAMELTKAMITSAVGGTLQKNKAN